MQPFILDSVIEAKQKKIKVSPQHVNRASSMGHPCLFYLYACREHWREKLPHDVFTQMMFEGGNVVEDKVIRDFQEAGLQVIEQQKAFEFRYLNLTGHLDCKVVKEMIPYPVEIKGLNPFEWEKLNCIEDFLQSKRSWVRSYPSQLLLYMLAENAEYGCFYIVNKVNWRPKEIWISLDLTYAEGILKKAEIINKAIETKNPPDKLCEPDVCQYCGFLHVCLPSMAGKEIDILDIQEVEDDLIWCMEHDAIRKEYEKRDKRWKEHLKEKEKVLIGDFLITGKWIERKPYTVEGGKYWQAKILVKPGKSIPTEDAA